MRLLFTLKDGTRIDSLQIPANCEPGANRAKPACNPLETDSTATRKKHTVKTIFVLLTALAALCGSTLGATTTIEGKFGRVEVDTERPSLTSLTLRRADGSLEPQSLLSPKEAPWQRGMLDWGTQALTFAVDETGRRFESRGRAPESVEQTTDGVTLRGVVLTDGAGEPVAREDWTVRRCGRGPRLDRGAHLAARTDGDQCGNTGVVLQHPPDQQQSFHDPAQLRGHDFLDRARRSCAAGTIRSTAPPRGRSAASWRWKTMWSWPSRGAGRC